MPKHKLQITILFHLKKLLKLIKSINYVRNLFFPILPLILKMKEHNDI